RLGREQVLAREQVDHLAGTPLAQPGGGQRHAGGLIARGQGALEAPEGGIRHAASIPPVARRQGYRPSAPRAEEGNNRRRPPMLGLNYLLGLLSVDMGIDLGTANTLVCVRGEGIVLNEPSVVAVRKGTNEVLMNGMAVGHAAKDMLGKTPSGIEAIRPL